MTSMLRRAMLYLGLGPDDEVLLPGLVDTRIHQPPKAHHSVRIPQRCGSLVSNSSISKSSGALTIT